MRDFYIIIFCLLSNFLAYSQTNYTLIDQNQVAAQLSDNGVLFYNAPMGLPGYEIPKGSGKSVIFATSIWLAGIDELGMLRNACLRFGNGQDLFPGPYSVNNMYNSSDYINKYVPGFWSVSKLDIDNHILNYQQIGYVVPTSIANWPGNGDALLGIAQNIAPFIDVNGDNLYTPLAGDYPDIRGDFATYIVMNDAAGIHTESNGEPLDVELHLMAYQFNSNNYLDSTTFLNMRVFNRGIHSYDNFKVALFCDGDVGGYSDDYMGSDSTHNLIYTYNADNNDDMANYGYGINPPCVGITSLNHPMNVSGYFTSSSNYPYNDPNAAQEYWNFMNGAWANNFNWYYGGMGYTGSPGVTTLPTNYLFSGNPYAGTGWTELSNNNTPGDRRMFMVVDSVSLNASYNHCYDFAILYNRQGNNLENVQGVIDLADSVLQFVNTQTQFNCNQVTASINQFENQPFLVYPNPTSGNLTLHPNESWGEFQIEIMDINGNLIFNENFNLIKEISFNLNGSIGIYILKITTKDSILMKKIEKY